MKRQRIRAFVLTAGYGTRLEPLTLFVPKPALPVCGEPVVGYTLRRLRRLGCEAAVLNLHHLAETIPAVLGQSYYGLPLVYSFEEEIQGTLGALYPQRQFLAAADLILLINGDTLCRWPLQAMIRRHLRTGAAVTLLLHRRAPAAELGGGVAVDSGGRVVQMRDSEPTGEVARRHVFAGAHVISNRVLDRLPEGSDDIIDGLYLPMLRDGERIESVRTGRKWHDLGTPERYLEANLDWVRGRWPWLGRRRNQISTLASVSAAASVQRSIVEAGAVVESDVQMSNSLLLPGARVASGSWIQHTIIGPGVRLAAANIERRMINRAKIEYRPTSEESMMGDFVYTPL